MRSPSGQDLYQWNEAGYFGVRYKLYEEGFVKKLGVTNMAVYYCILAHTDRKAGYAVLSVREIAQAVGICKLNVIIECLKQLERFQFISTQKHQGKKTHYWPLHESSWQIDETYKARKPRSDKGKPQRKRQKPMSNYAKHLQSLTEQERYNELQRQRMQLLTNS
jgi:hypothetical protein